MDATHTRTATSIADRLSSATMVGRWAVGMMLAVLLVTAAYLLAGTVGDPLVVRDIGTVDLASVLGFTVLGATVGLGIAFGSRRFARKPRMAFLTLTITALAAYSVVPFTAAESLQTAIWLNVFHLMVAIPVVGSLAIHLPESRTG